MSIPISLQDSIYLINEAVGVLLFRLSLFQNGADVGTFPAFTCKVESSQKELRPIRQLYSNVITSHKPRPKRTKVILIIK